MSALSSLSSLTKLGMRLCHRVSDAGFALGLSNLTEMETLDIAYFKLITNGGLSQLNKMGKLTDLDIGTCKKISDEGVRTLCGLGALTQLDASRCHKITDAGLGLLATSLRNLNNLFLSKCRIGDEGLLNLAPLAHSLSLLDISGCENVTDAGMPHLVHLTSLNSLMVSETKVSSAGLLTLSQLSSLQALNAYRCPNILLSAVTQLRLSCPRLNVNCDFDRGGRFGDTPMPMAESVTPITPIESL